MKLFLSKDAYTVKTGWEDLVVDNFWSICLVHKKLLDHLPPSSSIEGSGSHQTKVGQPVSWVWIFELKLGDNVFLWLNVCSVECLSVLKGGLSSWESDRERERREKRDGQNESEVTMLPDFWADICHFACSSIPPHFVYSVLYSFRDYLTLGPYELGITDKSSLLASCFLSIDSRQKKVVLTFWWLPSGET